MRALLPIGLKHPADVSSAFSMANGTRDRTFTVAFFACSHNVAFLLFYWRSQRLFNIHTLPGRQNLVRPQYIL